MKKHIFSKNFITTALLVTVISSAILQPKRSEATIAAALVAPESAVVVSVFNGLMIGTTAAFGISMITSIPVGQLIENTVGWQRYILAFVLDDSGNQKLVFKPVDRKFASQAGITADEQESYNHELDIIQATFDDISAQVAPMKASERTEASRKLWSEYRSVMSPASFSALEKITNQMAR